MERTRLERNAIQRRSQTPVQQYTAGIGSDLNSRPAFAEFGFGFKQVNARTGLSQGNRRAETANSASCYEDRIIGYDLHVATVQRMLTIIVRFLIEAIGRVRLQGADIGVISVERGAVGANDLIVGTHIQINMGMVHRGPCAHTLEFLHANVDFFHTDIVAKMGRAICRHRLLYPPFRDLRVDAAALDRKAQPLSTLSIHSAILYFSQDNEGVNQDMQWSEKK